ncbi:MAG: TatD family hydrolase [Acidimicrobiales bacterium]
MSGPSSAPPFSALRPWFDSHCHVQPHYRRVAGGEGTENVDPFDEAAAAGVGGLVCIGTDASTSAEAVATVVEARRSGATVGTWATVGLHPHDALNGLDELQNVLATALAAQRDIVVAVGECGLDYHYDHSPRPVQRDAFAAQVELARRHDLALVVHSRGAWDDTLDILRANTPERLVLHCFTGDEDDARACLDLGAYLSFSGIVTFKNADDVRRALGACPVERILVETDAPFLAPVPHRGAVNRPAWVTVVGEAVARHKGIEPQALAEAAWRNAAEVFSLR